VIIAMTKNNNSRVLPAVLAAFVEEREVSDPDGGKTPKEEMREKIATMKKLLDDVSSLAKVCGRKLERKNANGDCAKWSYFRPVIIHVVKSSCAT